MKDESETKTERTPTGAICARVKAYLDDRETWETRQDIWYKMRHHGLRRKRMPFAGAADMHYPLIDSTIDKLTPFYIQQFTGAPLLADFTASDIFGKDNLRIADQAARYFDWYMKNSTNFEDEIDPLVDTMLLTGKAVVKIRWDERRDALDFNALDPLFFIVPTMAKNLQDAESVTEVIQLTPAQYRRIKVYKQDGDFVERLLVKGDENGEGEETNDVKYTREGITQPDGKNIVIWQTYRKEDVEETISLSTINPLTGEKIQIQKKQRTERVKVYTYAPHMPDEPVREPFILPYEHNQYPFVDFPMEVKEKRWYSSRGIAERLAAFEAYLCKTWNEKCDAMTYFNSPVYKASGSIPNASNLNFKPGSVVTADIQRIDSGQPPISFDQEMTNARAVAETLVQVPDFALGKQNNLNEPRTATEVNAISRMSNAGLDSKASLFRKRIKLLYIQAWSLIKQFGSSDRLNYILDGQVHSADKNIMEHKFEIAPAGAANSWNVQYLQQQALSLFQLFNGDPLMNQVGLRKMVLERTVPDKVEDLLVDPSHEIEIKRILSELQQAEAQGIAVPQEAKRIALEQIRSHFDAIKQANPALAQQLGQQLAQMMQPQAQPQAIG